MIKVMMDNEAYPLWNIKGENYNCIQETGIVYDESLEEDINLYQTLWARFEEEINHGYTLTWEPVDRLAEKIALHIKRINRNEDVIYYDETSDRWWEIDDDNKGASLYEG